MMGPQVTIRRTKREDLDRVLAIEQESETAPHWSRRIYEELLQGPAGVTRCFLVAESERGTALGSSRPEVIGFAVAVVCSGALSEVAGCVGELESVVVQAGFRRSGAGRALCLAAVQWCRSEGAGEVQLEVRAGSGGAVSLYRSLGFAEAGRRPRYYREPEDDALLMRLSLQGRSR